MIRKAQPADLDRILDIYAAARAFMAQAGNPDQWGDGYPYPEVVREDIALGRLYADEEDGRICGVFMFAVGDDPTYTRIEDGAWLSDAPYAVIHRVAGDGTTPGTFRRCVDYCRSQFPHLRMDTHKDNHIMQSLLTRAGFVRCGIIYSAQNRPLIAYELLP